MACAISRDAIYKLYPRNQSFSKFSVNLVKNMFLKKSEFSDFEAFSLFWNDMEIFEKCLGFSHPLGIIFTSINRSFNDKQNNPQLLRMRPEMHESHRIIGSRRITRNLDTSTKNPVFNEQLIFNTHTDAPPIFGGPILTYLFVSMALLNVLLFKLTDRGLLCCMF